VSVYVDDVAMRWRGKRWYHLTADSTEELHAFAAKVGLKREWFQESEYRREADHYDVTDSFRDKSILLGAIPESWREGAARRRAARAVSPVVPQPGSEEGS
jgi:hypothetical protein